MSRVEPVITAAVAHSVGPAVTALQERAGRDPDGVWSAPGRVNLIGEHTDYNDGHVLPFAIDLRTVVAAARRRDRRIRCWSLQDSAAAEGTIDDPRSVRGWAAYVCGTIWALRESGVDVPGLDLVVDGRVPLGSGLSSSAALESAVALASTELAGGAVDRLALARAGQRAEQEVVGAPVGPMDQVASMCALAGRALLLDCRDLSLSQVELPDAGGGVRWLVIDSHVRHDNASGDYGRRREECQRAASALGVPALRDATVEQVSAADLPDVLRRRARHVVTEEQRVQAVVRDLAARDLPSVGRELLASHASLRDDFEVSVPEIDDTVAAAVGAGAWGARMTGGGFGGCVLAAVPAAAGDAVAVAVVEASSAERRPRPTIYDVVAADGARREALSRIE